MFTFSRTSHFSIFIPRKAWFNKHSAWSESCACLTPTPTILRGGQSANFDEKPSVFFLSERSRMSTLSVQKFWAKKLLIISRNSEKRIWPHWPNSEVQKNRNLESGVVLLCWILLHITKTCYDYLQAVISFSRCGKVAGAFIIRWKPVDHSIATQYTRLVLTKHYTRTTYGIETETKLTFAHHLIVSKQAYTRLIGSAVRVSLTFWSGGTEEK